MRERRRVAWSLADVSGWDFFCYWKSSVGCRSIWCCFRLLGGEPVLFIDDRHGMHIKWPARGQASSEQTEQARTLLLISGSEPCSFSRMKMWRKANRERREKWERKKEPYGNTLSWTSSSERTILSRLMEKKKKEINKRKCIALESEPAGKEQQRKKENGWFVIVEPTPFVERYVHLDNNNEGDHQPEREKTKTRESNCPKWKDLDLALSWTNSKELITIGEPYLKLQG